MYKSLEEQLLDQGPAAILDRAALEWEGLNWHGIAEVCALKARTLLSAELDAALAWANASTHLYARLAKTHPGDAESYERSGLTLRAGLIQKLGPIPGDELRDPADILAWVSGSLVLPREDAKARSSLWRAKRGQLPVAELRTLRRIKNRLGLIEVIASVPGVQIPPLILSWLAIRGELP